MTTNSLARTTSTFKKKVLLLSVGMFAGLVYNALAQQSMKLEQHSAELVKLQPGVAEVFVANPEIADIQLNSPTAAYVYGKKAGMTTIFASDKQGKQMLKMTVQVMQNVTPLKRAIASVYPDERVHVTSAPQGLILSGEVNSARASKDIHNMAMRYVEDNQDVVNNMTISTPTQVYLKVKVVEVNRSVLKQLDFNWGANAVTGNFTFGVLTGRAPIVGGVFARGQDASAGLNSYGFRAMNAGNYDISSLIDALNRESMATVLAEPNLIAMSGQSANVLVGGEFPFPVPQEDTITIEFKQFGVSLSFVPTILSKDHITLHVRPEVSELDPNGGIQIPVLNGSISVPSIKTRRAETTVELGNGDSLAIAGLFSRNLTNTVSKIPGIGDLPVLGALFNSSQFKRNETELVIIVTPHLVKPVRKDTLATPNEGLKYSSQLGLVLANRLNEPGHASASGMKLTGAKFTGDQTDVVFEQPLAAYGDADIPTSEDAADARAAVMRHESENLLEEITLIGDAGFYTE